MPGNKFILALVVLLDIGLAYFCASYIRRGKEPVQAGQAQQPAGYVAWTTPAMAQCINLAAITYQVPANVLGGIMRVEGGRIGQAVGNKNGTYDLGPMQVNSLWIPQLARLWHVDYATAYRAVRDDPCENVYISAWILKQKIAQSGGLVGGVGLYHSANAAYARPYVSKVAAAMPGVR